MLAKDPHNAAVPTYIGVNLAIPECMVRNRDRPALGAAVPEAAVDEDGKATLEEDEIRRTLQAGVIHAPA